MTINELNSLANMVAYLECDGIKCEICPLRYNETCVSVHVAQRIDELRKVDINKIIEVFVKGKEHDTKAI